VYRCKTDDGSVIDTLLFCVYRFHFVRRHCVWYREDRYS